EHTYALLREKQIALVIPNLDETLLGWSERKRELLESGVRVVVSDPAVIRICQDKWLLYKHFVRCGIPTPNTSLKQEHSLVKPRRGRGGKGVVVTDSPVSMTGMISQSLLRGQEYSIDVFCDRTGKPIYIVPRKRLKVKDGKSTAGVTMHHPVMIEWVRRICASLPFNGPINIQCFETEEGEISFTEINPRVAGAMALAFAASENWIGLWIEHFIYGRDAIAKPVSYGLRMMRYYKEIFM
ncbi:MAG: ATP-grasp domain-containing protein, partial [Cohnella sp.]|nr:ATP-grasp domain-containing protein [Cohnella sp.]